MKPKVSKKAIKFKRSISPVREIMNYADFEYIKKLGFKPCDIISFAGGWVNHKAPEGLRKSYQEIIDSDALFHLSGEYPPTLGTFEYKQAIVEFEKHLYNIKNLDVSQIAIGMGSTQLASDLFQVLLEPGDKILLLDPSYCNYPTQVITALLDIHILRFPVMDDESWTYIADSKMNKFYNFILENTPKVILLISPDNPTSQILSDKFVQSALEATREIGSFLIIDFAYKEIVFKEKYPVYFSWNPNDNFISLHSNSKWCHGLGRRSGWIEAPQFVIESMESIFNSTILCPDMLHQMALTKYINSAIKEDSLESYVRETSQKYYLAAQQTVSSIKEYLGLPYLTPQGGLYTCVKVGIDGAKFVENVLKETGVLLVPGWGFGRTLHNAVRISYGPLVNELETISRGLEKVGMCLNK